MDHHSDNSPCKRLRVSNGDHIDKETGMVIDGNVLQEGDAVRDDSQNTTSWGERDTIDANIPNTLDGMVAASGDRVNNYALPLIGPFILDRRLPDVLRIPQNCGERHQPFTNTESEDSGALATGSTYRNQSEGSVEMGNQSADSENVATCAGFSVSNRNDTTNTDWLNDANKSDEANPGSAGSEPRQEPNYGTCDYVQNIQAIADNSYPRMRENACLISTYDRNISQSKPEYVPNLESPKLKRTLDRTNTNLAKKRMESVIHSTVDEVRDSKSFALDFKEVFQRESYRGESSLGACSVNNDSENEKGNGGTESKPFTDLEPGTIFLTGPGNEENREAKFDIHSYTPMKIHAIDTIETDKRSVDIHRNKVETIVRLSDMSDITGLMSSDMHGDANRESNDSIAMHGGTYNELIKNHVDIDDNKKNSNASGSTILPAENIDDSGFMEMFSNSPVGSACITSYDMTTGISLTRNSGKESQTGRLSQGSLTLNRIAVTESGETNLACGFSELNNLLEDISGGNVNEGSGLVGADNGNDTLDECLTLVPSSCVPNITCSQSSASPSSYSTSSICSQSSASTGSSSKNSMCSQSSASPSSYSTSSICAQSSASTRSSSKNSMCSQSSASSRSGGNSRACTQSSSSLRSYSSSSLESKTLQYGKQTLGVTANTTFGDINTVSFQAFHAPTAAPSTSESDRTDASLVSNDKVATDLHHISDGVEEDVPQCSSLQLDGVHTEHGSKESADGEQGLLLNDGRLKLDFEFDHVRGGVIDTNTDFTESGNDKHGLTLVNRRLKLDFDQTQEINGLPITVLVNILRHLTVFELLRRASLVCKYWYNLCRDPDIWRNIYLVNQDRLTDEDLIRLLTFADHRVRNINLTDCRFLTDYGFKYLLRNCPQIEVLQLMRCFDLTDLAFKGLHRKGRCRKLYSLHLDGCCRAGTKALFELSEACPRMRDLRLNQCMKVCDAGITAIARRCPDLINLQLDHCTLVSDDAISEIVLGCPGMLDLNLMSCSITDRGVKYLSKLLKLRNVDLSNIPHLTSDSMIYMSRFCKDLQCVNVSLNTAVDDHCIAQIASNLPKLRRLYCVSCSLSDKGLQDIAKYRPTLETLDVGWCKEVTDHGVRVVSLACNHLKYFGLIRCDRVSVEAMEELVIRFPAINYSTFLLESRKLLERARSEGYTFNIPGFKISNS